jgi:hypothetical protein
LQDFAENDNYEDSNASDDDFKLDDEYQEEIGTEIALEEEDGSVGNDDPDLQEEYFQTPIQQLNTDVSNNNEATSVVVRRSKRGGIPNPIVTLNNIITTETQKCAKQKNKSNVEQEILIEEDVVEDDHVTIENNKSTVDTVEIKDNDTSADDELVTSAELESDLGPYWTLAQSCQSYVSSTITSYSNIEASKSTPQYGFNRGLKEFGELGYEATVKELDDNLIGMGVVKMLEHSEMNKNIRSGRGPSRCMLEYQNI